MNTANTMPTLPPLPEFPPSEQTLREVAERLDHAKQILREGAAAERELENRLSRTLARSITGKHGWSATLVGISSHHLTIRAPAAYALQNVLEPLADWWQLAVQDAVTHSPEPENATRQSRTKSGRNRILRTPGQRHGASGDLVLPSGEWQHVSIDSALDFDGKASTRDII